MAIDQFTKEQFEDALSQIHPGYSLLGLAQGEECYAISASDNARLIIRSSIDRSGKAASTGKDSIRLWLEVQMPNGNYRAISKKVDAYTTRIPGWQKRLEDKIRILWDRLIQFRQPVELCPKCSQIPGVNLSKQEQSYGRPFAACQECKWFMWLDKPIEKGSKVEFEDSVVIAGLEFEPSSYEQGLARIERKEITERLPGYEGLNDNQYIAATSPVDQNIRLLAPPGSGKTHTVKHRYQFLVDNGIDPDNILVVTFSKAMADEMGSKIQAQVLNANLDQISTIHAFCFRLLRNWTNTPYNGWNFPKHPWSVKKIIDDLVMEVWQDEEKPNYNEVLSYIDFAKYKNDFNKEFFIEALGFRWGHWLWEIASKYQATMQRNREMDFADMLWYTEQLLESDDRFRNWCYNRFQYIIIDEGQDANSQAMRILIGVNGNSKPRDCQYIGGVGE